MFSDAYQGEVMNGYSCYDQRDNYYNGQADNLTSMTPEQSYYADYDREMARAVAEADSLDYYYNNGCQEDQYRDEEMNQSNEYYDYNDNNLYHQQNKYEQQQQEEYHYENDSLLSLIVGVQSYLQEQASVGAIRGKSDSPLYGLQYKMYIYMRQRACEMGVQF